MSTLVLRSHLPTALYVSSASASESGTKVRQALQKATADIRSVATSAQSLAVSSLARVLGECGRAGWDGYHAHAVSTVTAQRAKDFLDALPTFLSAPEIVPEPDGDIAITWYFGPALQLSISVGPSGPLNFAGVIGEQYGQKRVRHGSEPFEGVVAGDLLEYVYELHERAEPGGRRRAA